MEYIEIDRNHTAMRKIADDAGVSVILLEGLIDEEIVQERARWSSVEVELAGHIAIIANEWNDWDDHADMQNCLRLRAWSLKVAQIGFDRYFGQSVRNLQGFEHVGFPLSLPPLD